MKVNFYATLRPIIGGKTVELELPAGSTVRQLLDQVFTQYPATRDVLLDEAGELLGHVHVFVNGRDAHFLDGALEFTLDGGDTVDVFPAVAGG